jgi:hypothetical protein
VDRAAFEDWVAAYERLWRTPGTGRLGELFADDATYSTAPYEPPYRGLEAIAALWERGRDGPDEDFVMTAEVIAVEAGTGVVRVEVRYGGDDQKEFRDLWVVRLGEDGRCTYFEEWPFAPPGQPGPDWQPGPA